MRKRMEDIVQTSKYDEGEVVLYKADNSVNLQVRIAEDTVWLSQAQMAELFGTQRQAITKHLKNIFDSNELSRKATCSILELLQKEGSRLVKRKIEFYNLDVIISVGFRVNTTRGIQFRQWANQVLKDYLIKGYAINYRLNNLEDKIDRKFAKTESEIEKIKSKIDFYISKPEPAKQGIFYDGQIFDAYVFVAELIKSAKKEITLIDNYIDDTVLTLIDKRNKGVKATIYTSTTNKQLQLDLQKHNSQYEAIEINPFSKSHDRFLCIDNDVYHIGASIKDLGKRWFAFARMEDLTPNDLTAKMS